MSTAAIASTPWPIKMASPTKFSSPAIRSISQVVVRLFLNVSYRVEPLQFDSGISSGELPLCAGANLVALGLPGCDRLVHLLGAGEAAADALPSEHAQLHLRHVEP